MFWSCHILDVGNHAPRWWNVHSLNEKSRKNASSHVHFFGNLLWHLVWHKGISSKLIASKLGREKKWKFWIFNLLLVVGWLVDWLIGCCWCCCCCCTSLKWFERTGTEKDCTAKVCQHVWGAQFQSLKSDFTWPLPPGRLTWQWRTKRLKIYRLLKMMVSSRVRFRVCITWGDLLLLHLNGRMKHSLRNTIQSGATSMRGNWPTPISRRFVPLSSKNSKKIREILLESRWVSAT